MKLWKTEIVVWTADDPQKMEASALVREGECGDGVVTKCQATLVSAPQYDPDAPPEDFFSDDDEQER